MKSAFRSCRRGLRPLPAVLAVTAVLLGPPAVHAQVTLFNDPPTAAELHQALTPRAAAGEAGDAGGPRSRGIRFGADAQKTITTPPEGGSPAVAGDHGERPAVAMRLVFDSGSAHLDRQSLPFLAALATLLKQDPTLKLTVEGHTDSTGEPGANLVLSWDRAMSVYHALVEKYGVDPARLQPVGKGMTEPLDAARPDDAANRRVQFRVAG